MIKQISSSDIRFKSVEFQKGFNVILADRSNTATEKDSRNGLGKSSLINVMHFLLGSSPKKDEGLRRKELSKSDYKMTLTLEGKEYIIKRNPERFAEVFLQGDFTGWEIQPEYDAVKKTYLLKNAEWTKMLGHKFFELSIEAEQKYFPKYRGLISFFIREGKDAYHDPFQHMGKQLEWDKQVQNAYLLRLNYEYAIALQIIKDKEEILQQLKTAAEQGLLGEFSGTIGDLEADRVRLFDDIKKFEEELNDFNVHPEYKEIQKEANAITKKIQDELNERNLCEQLLSRYSHSLDAESEADVESVEKIYKEAGVVFPDALVRSLEEIKGFHLTVIKNRKDYLEAEVKKLTRQITVHDISIAQLSDKRKELLQILKTHGALEEHFKLQQRLLEKQEVYNAVVTKISNLRKFQEGKSDLKIEKEDLLKKMRSDYNERKEIIDEAIILFNQNSESLYNEPGNLSIDVANTGYKFKVEIKRSGSTGIDAMKVLCYDLTLAQLRAKQVDKPGFLVHDSAMFDGVDERQIAKGLERAYELSEKFGFQYICTLNSDIIPYKEFSAGFTEKFEKAIRLRLDDSSEAGGLFGFRF